MNFFHYIIVAALLFSGFAFYTVAKLAVRDAFISWHILRVLRIPGFTFLSKPGDMPLGIALVCRLLAASLWGYSAWCFAHSFFVLVPVTWKIVVVW